ncbi:unnamed protein product [Rotaria magnacalcarata]|uniref:LIM zinc-binding domain-containing protein n=5 Tax=Rotaria TaxID=231623 RepID=A0A816VWB0_9BILA|nr:unnamed protein product [Rotaria magnacalcarata]CAF1552312.1 unnamed protein product [Rotaria magnacalcarata]CAF1996763.1 unnamed protein product [Rotaria magnacalcarata]CAF2077974.1 unnamed protein product [Rotaria magnacalcarata]CAF2125267.1 unnamed protein product [Rotaria magnacalcarata]
MPQWGGGGEICPRCQKTVYPAEKLAACSAAWHKGCFKCKTCNSILTLASYKDFSLDIYCKSCYQDKLHPHERNRKQLETKFSRQPGGGAQPAATTEAASASEPTGDEE